MNVLFLTGYTGSEPEVKTFQDGSEKVTVSFASSEKWNDRNTGEPREKTEWHRLRFRNNLHNVVKNHLTKGRHLAVVGKVTYGNYKKDNGETVYYTEIDVYEMEFLDSKNGSNNQSSKQYSQNNQVNAQQTGQAAQMNNQVHTNKANDFVNPNEQQSDKDPITF